jgi:hypothetical protein
MSCERRWAPLGGEGSTRAAPMTPPPYLALPHKGEGTEHSKRSFAFPRRDSPGLCMKFPPRYQRAWGMPGAQCTRSRACSVVNTRVSHRRSPGNHPAFPHANGFNGFLRALPGDRAFLSPSPARALGSRELDAGVEASGPHDFAVRFLRCSSRAHPRPPHPAPR